MQRVSEPKRTAGQRALEKCGLVGLEISPYLPSTPLAEGDTLLHVRRRLAGARQQKIPIFVHLHVSGEIYVYGEIGEVPDSRPCGIWPGQEKYRMVAFPAQP